MKILYKCTEKHIGLSVGKIYKEQYNKKWGYYIIDNDGQTRNLGDLLSQYKIKRYSPRKIK